jgi:GTPase SAR1 family protein
VWCNQRVEGVESSRARIRAGLERVAELLDDVEFTLPTPDRETLERERRAIVAVVEDYLLPRLDQPDAPVVAAVVGAAGVGKSTIVNSLAQDMISKASARRPTTTTPVLWAHDDQADSHAARLVALLKARRSEQIELVVGADELTRNLTVVDTPPIDHAEVDGVTSAREVLALADLCVFVTSASRYADAAGWDVIVDARDRGLPLLFVLNRLPANEAQQQELKEDFAKRLASERLLDDADPSFVFGVAEGDVAAWHMGLDPHSVSLLRKELSELSDPDLRASLLDRVAVATGQALGVRLNALAKAFKAEQRHIELLLAYADGSYADQIERIERELTSGSFSELAELDTWSQAAVDLTGIVTRRAGVAAQDAASAWFEDAVGGVLLASGGQGLWRHAHDTTYDTQQALEKWGASLEGITSSLARRGKLSERTSRKMARRLWPAVLDPGRDPKGMRPLGDRGREAVIQAREKLVETLVGALRLDAARFEDSLGQAAPDELMAELGALERIVAIEPGTLVALPEPRVIVVPDVVHEEIDA